MTEIVVLLVDEEARRMGSRVVTSIPEGWKRVSVPAGVPRTGRSCCRAIGYS